MFRGLKICPVFFAHENLQNLKKTLKTRTFISLFSRETANYSAQLQFTVAHRTLKDSAI